jgi:Bacterial regulatory helix-turn-helix protein, lysR family
MEIHQLRYFVAIAEEGSFSNAAEREHVSQPSLSQQIHKLEEELPPPQRYGGSARSSKNCDGGVAAPR